MQAHRMLAVLMVLATLAPSAEAGLRGNHHHHHHRVQRHHHRVKRHLESPEVVVEPMQPEVVLEPMQPETSPEIILEPITPMGPGGCSVIKPMCAQQGTGGTSTNFQTWQPECEDGKWVCGEAPPQPEISPCVITPPTDPSGCPMIKPMCVAEQDLPDGTGKVHVEFEATCHDAILEGGKKEKQWLCEEPQSENPGLSKQCCRAGSLKCRACAAGLSEEDFCTEHPEFPGCEAEGEPAQEAPRGCCRAFSAKCNACIAGQTVDEYCEENPDAGGCEWGEEDDGEVRDFMQVAENKYCGERGKRVAKDVDDLESCVALAEGADYDAFLFGYGPKRGRCVGVTLDVSEALWRQYSNAELPCASDWQDVKKFKFFVLEPEQ